MSASVVRRLIWKDLDLARPFIFGSLAAGVLSLAMLPWNVVGFYVGGVMFLVVLIVLNCLIATLSVVGERKEKIALFVLSLPISTAQFAAAKIISSLIAFVVPWLLLTVAAVVLLDLTPLPNGFIPVTVAISVFCLLYFCVLLGVALVTDSGLWITSVILAGNVGINFLLQILFRLPSSVGHLSGPVAVWGGDVAAITVLEAVLGAAALAAGWFVYSRKKEFV